MNKKIKVCVKCGKEIPPHITYSRCKECRTEEALRLARARNHLAQKLKLREKGERLLQPRPPLCGQYDPINLTCIACRENAEEKYMGCFKKKA